MSCEHYWRDGILLAERGEPDPHRETCIECRRAHAAREQLIHALPLVGGGDTGDPNWQNHVWRRIAQDAAWRARRSYWIGGGLAAAAFAIALVYMRLSSPAGSLHAAEPQLDSAGSSGMERPRFVIVSGKLAMRSSSARVGDRVRIWVGQGHEARVYRVDQLLLRCRAQTASPGCVPDDQGLVAETELTTAGDYHLVVIAGATADPVGTLDRDLAAVVAAGGDHKITELSVR